MKSILLFLTLSLTFLKVNAQEELYNSLNGKYEVGFQRHYVKDSARTYTFLNQYQHKEKEALSYKPMIVNVWYPTNIKNCKTSNYSIYLDFKSDENPSWKGFLDKISAFNDKTIVENIFRRTYLKDTIKENDLYQKFLDFDSKVCLNAPSLNEPLPLIIYQQGLGGTVEENAVLCRFLASNGYVVVNSTYHSDDSEKINSDWNLERSESDVNFILNYVQSIIQIDQTKINLLGFSFGAQSNFNLATKLNNIKSVVSFDSRFEYYYDYSPRGFKNLPNDLIERNQDVTVPLLVFSNDAAPFSIIDSLVYSKRTYVMVKNFKHYDFTSHRHLANSFLNYELKDDLLKTKSKQFIEICKHSLDFFNFYNYQFPKKSTISRNENFYLEKMEIGASKPKLNKRNLDSPRKVLLGIDKFGFDFIKKHYPNKKVVVPEDLINLYAYDLIAKEKLNLAISIFEWGVELYPESSNLFDSLGEALYLNKDYPKSLLMFKRSLELNSNNKNAVKYISIIEALN